MDLEQVNGLLDQKFPTREELIDGVRNIFSMQGYAISIKSSRKDKYVTIGCDRGGCYRDKKNVPKEFRKRKTSTRLINCPFEIKGKRHDDGFWKLEMKNSSHNHEASSDISGHPSCRRLSSEEITRVKEMSMSGIAPRQILSSLRLNDSNIQAVSRNIYNMKHKIHQENLAGRTVIQALFDELSRGGFIYNVVHDQNGCLTHLFFAHPTSITLTKSYPDVFVMDCTYKTNRYKLPLLDIVGVSSFNTSFYSCFAFLANEAKEDYIWALTMFSNILGPNCRPSVIVTDRELALMNAMKIVFPRAANILCIWHIEKNILKKCKPYFEAKEADWNVFLSSWNEVVYAKTKPDFKETWELFELLYEEKKDVINYIQETWLPFKKQFISAWTEKYMHFGNRASSRAEGAHSKLKKYLQVSTGDFLEVKKKICLAIDNEFQEIKTQMSSERLRVPHDCEIPFFGEVVRHVSKFALHKLVEQYELVKYGSMNLICTGHFMATMGLPCAHKMSVWKDGVLPLIAIHPHWRIDTRSLATDNAINKEVGFKELLNEFEDRYQQWPIVQKENARETISRLASIPLPSLLEPNIQPHKGRPSQSKKKKKDSSSTKRDPSGFEIVETTRKCGICGGVGHNRRSCERKFEANEQSHTFIPNITPEYINNFF